MTVTESDYVASMTPGQRRRYERQKAITPLVKVRVEMAAEHTCAYCRRVGARGVDPDGVKWHVDHVVPVSQGGTHDMSNLALACARCNRVKSDCLLSDLYEHLALMLAARAS